MEKKFDEQHAKVMRLNNTLKENMKAFERMEEEKLAVTAELTSLEEKYRCECAERAALEENLRSTADECQHQLARIDTLESRTHSLNEQLHSAEQKMDEWRDKWQAEKECSQEHSRCIAELNERLGKAESVLQSERSAKRKYESEIDQLEEELRRLKEDGEKAGVRAEAMREQLRVKEASVRRAERKLEDKTAEMEDCVAELKKMHKASLNELQTKLDELRRKCMRLETENAQQKARLEPAAASFERDSSVEPSDYAGGRHSSLSRGHYGSRHSVTGSMTSSTMSIGGRGALASRRRETEPELMGLRSPSYHETKAQTHCSLLRSPSNSSSTTSPSTRQGRGLSRTGTLSNMTTSLTNTLDSGLARSSSASSSHLLQLQASEKRVVTLEREIQQMKSDGQLVKREMEVYRLSLQESERAKEGMKKQIAVLNGEVEKLGGELKTEEERSQQLEFDVRRIGAECESWKKRLEEHLNESKTELMAEK